MKRTKGSPISVFESLGLRNVQELQLKAQLAEILNDSLSEQREPQVKLAKRLGITQPRVSALRNYRLSDFSAAELIRLLMKLGHNVAITVDPVLRPEGSMLVESRRVESDAVPPPVISSYYGGVSPRTTEYERAKPRTQRFYPNLLEGGYRYDVEIPRAHNMNVFLGPSRAMQLLVGDDL